MTPDVIGVLLAFAAQFYDLVMLDMGTGMVDPLARLALQRADQVLVLTSTDYVTATNVLDAVEHVDSATSERRSAIERMTLVINKVPPGGDGRPITEVFARAGVRRQVLLPHDEQLARMLDTATYSMEALRRSTRLAIRELGIAVGQRLV